MTQYLYFHAEYCKLLGLLRETSRKIPCPSYSFNTPTTSYFWSKYDFLSRTSQLGVMFFRNKEAKVYNCTSGNRHIPWNQKINIKHHKFTLVLSIGTSLIHSMWVGVSDFLDLQTLQVLVMSEKPRHAAKAFNSCSEN